LQSLQNTIMQDHASGPTKGHTRQGALDTSHSFSLDIVNNLTGVDLKLTTIAASLTKPVAVTLEAVIVAADNSGTSSVLRIGTAAGGTTILNDVDLKAAAGVNYVPANATLIVTADTDLYARITRVGTAATAGQVVVLARLREVNIKQPTTSGG
jgi:hypothetical protein